MPASSNTRTSPEKQRVRDHYLIGRLLERGELNNIDAVVIVDADSTIDRGLSGHSIKICDRARIGFRLITPSPIPMVRGVRGFSLTPRPCQWSDTAGKSPARSEPPIKGNGMCLSVRGFRRRALALSWAGRGHGVLLGPPAYEQTCFVSTGLFSVRPNARVRGQAAINQRRHGSSVKWKFAGSSWCHCFDRVASVSQTKCSEFGTHHADDGIVRSALCRCFGDRPAVLAWRTASPLSLFRPFLIITFGLITFTLAPISSRRSLRCACPGDMPSLPASFPIYYLWKIRLLFGGRPDRWVRTPRKML